ncbi:MAG: archaeal proteasome endopeptidase complex subunit alpha [Infirmifilum sp.]|jgi:proteasome alpha subunit|uniref:Proteasome subunit alpha n=1 Tax=Infirmifilum uzonense TaxID=1550241 RepID=A0A0F7FIG5_9CREN|nr:archaeal proteasome endopeptidase complex subunit alpha [Infirmifilum uzonense]AKG39149.1 proteasome subunit alpha [Infirmifilum uzonense]
MFPAAPMAGYDRAITIFSPEGRLYQVEYAYEAVKRGMTALGVKAVDGVVLAVEKRSASPLVEGTEKIKMIDQHVGVAFAGLFGDARVLIDQARIYAQSHRLVYGEPVPIELLVKRICDIKQMYTQHGGVRPFGVAFLFAGVDRKGVHLIQTDPGGTYLRCKARAIGTGAQKAIDLFTREYTDNIKIDQAILLALRALKESMEDGFTAENIELAKIDVYDRTFKIFSTSEVQDFISKL